MELVKVTPIEYGRNVIKRYYSVKISEFTPQQVYDYIATKNFAQMPKIWQEEDMILYQYPNQPIIIIKDGGAFTTREEWARCDEGKIRQQASILMRILKDAGFATYNRRSIRKARFTPTKFKPYSTRYYYANKEAQEEREE